MIVVRFKVRCQPDKTDQVMAALREVVSPSRTIDGVINFDIARDLVDPNSFIATEVFENEAALERQEAQPEVKKALSVIEESVATEPEATVYHVSASEPWTE